MSVISVVNNNCIKSAFAVGNGLKDDSKNNTVNPSHAAEDGLKNDGHNSINPTLAVGDGVMPTSAEGSGLKSKSLTPSDLNSQYSNSYRSQLSTEVEVGSVVPLADQVAGHGSEKGKKGGERGILTHEDGYILKPIQAPPKGERELAFYNHISTSKDLVDQEIYSLLPQFYGTAQVEGLMEESGFLMLENLCRGMNKPCVMDIKIGAKTYGPDATPAKRIAEDAKYIGTKKPLGYSVLGIISHSCEEGGARKRWDKTFGLNLNQEQTHLVLRNYFDCQHQDDWTESRCIIVEKFILQLKRILRLFARQNRYRFYASSLLFAYDYHDIERPSAVDMKNIERPPRTDRGESQSDTEKIENEQHSRMLSEEETLTNIFQDGSVQLRVIDFAHVFPVNNTAIQGLISTNDHELVDTNFLKGIESLLRLFENFLAWGKSTNASLAKCVRSVDQKQSSADNILSGSLRMIPSSSTSLIVQDTDHHHHQHQETGRTFCVQRCSSCGSNSCATSSSCLSCCNSCHDGYSSNRSSLSCSFGDE